MTHLPEDWQEVPFAGIFVLPSLGTRKIKVKDCELSGAFPVIDQGQQFISGYTDSEELVTRVDDPVIVFGDHTRCVKFVNFDFVAGADGIKLLQPRRNLDGKFAFYLLQATELRAKGYARHFSLLKARSFAIPPLAEQARIVEILEEQFSRLDSALASIRAVREKAQAFRRSLLQAAFSGELTGGTQGWQKVSLIDAAEVVMGQSPPGSSYNGVGVGKPFFQGKAEFGDRYPTVKKWTTAGTKSALAGDILMSVRAPVGPTNIANVDCVIGRGLAAIRAKAITNQTYLLWTLRSIESDIAAKGVGTTFSSISGSALRSTSLTLPPLSIQARIVEVLEEQFSRLDNALEVTNELEERIAAERRSLLHSAFSGTLTASWRENHV